MAKSFLNSCISFYSRYVTQFFSRSCMLSANNPYVYYLSFLGPCCLILAVNLAVFLMVTRVLFAPRAIATKKPQGKKEKVLVTTAQVRGAFTVMVSSCRYLYTHTQLCISGINNPV